MDQHQPADIPAAVRAHVAYAVTSLLTPEELESWSVRWVDDDGGGSGGRCLCVDLVAGGEPYRGYLHDENADYPVADALDGFVDGLEDFISESRFAWGQQRLLADRPWRHD